MALMLVGAPLLLLLGSCGGDGDTSEAPESTAVLTGEAMEFRDLLYDGLNATYRVTYETTTPEGMPGGNYIVYSQPPLARIDTVPAARDEPDSLIITGGPADQTFGCAGGTDAWECSEIESLGDSAIRVAGPVAFLSSNDIAQTRVSKTTGRPIAGQQTTCFELAPVGSDGAGEVTEYCLTAEGVVLLAASPSQTVEATEYSPQVSSEDFIPPSQAS
jgi:hypothetical protein